MNAFSNFFDSAAGRITDPVAFMAADADIKRAVISAWAWAMDMAGQPGGSAASVMDVLLMLRTRRHGPRVVAGEQA